MAFLVHKEEGSFKSTKCCIIALHSKRIIVLIRQYKNKVLPNTMMQSYWYTERRFCDRCMDKTLHEISESDEIIYTYRHKRLYICKLCGFNPLKEDYVLAPNPFTKIRSLAKD